MGMLGNILILQGRSGPTDLWLLMRYEYYKLAEQYDMICFLKISLLLTRVMTLIQLSPSLISCHRHVLPSLCVIHPCRPYLAMSLTTSSRYILLQTLKEKSKK